MDPGTVAVCGDSAGGGIAMALLLALKDRGLPLPGGGILFCPAVDIEGNLQDPDDPRHVMYVRGHEPLHKGVSRATIRPTTRSSARSMPT